MKVVCYFAAAEGAHPHCSIAEYDKIWPVMAASVERCGYELIHLTSLEDRPRSNHVIRYDVDPKTVMFSREVAWRNFLQSLTASETAVLVEPDCYLLRKIPPLLPGFDMMLLSRPGKCSPPGFRLAKKSAIPFYDSLVALYSTYSDDKKVFHGDGEAHQALAGDSLKHPMLWHEGFLDGAGVTVRIEVRNWLDYTSKLWKGAVAWNFKGDSKHVMLSMANGVMPRMR